MILIRKKISPVCVKLFSKTRVNECNYINLQRDTIFEILVSFPGQRILSKMGSTQNGKNVLLADLILFPEIPIEISGKNENGRTASL